MRLPDRVTGLFLVGLGAAAAYGGWQLPPVPGQPVGPNVFPLVIGTGLALCGLAIAFGIGPPSLRSRTMRIGPHVVVITIDGFRWQEIFNGADSLIINNEQRSLRAALGLAIGADPLVDIRNTQKIQLVVRGGEVLEPAALLEEYARPG